MTGLPLNTIVDVSVSWQQANVTGRNFGSLLIIGDSGILSENETTRFYTSLTELANDFNDTTPEYKCASVFFSQSPQPSMVYVGALQSGENALQALQRLRTATNSWYCVTFALSSTNAPTNTQLQSIATYVEGCSPSTIFCYTTQDSSVLSSTSTADIASTLSTASGYDRTFIQYSSSNPYAAVSIFGVFATVNYSGNNTCTEAAFRSEPTITPEVLQPAQSQTLDSKNCNYFATYASGNSFVQKGVCCSGKWIDSVIGVDAFINALQVAGINCLQGLPKVPLTPSGVSTLEAYYTRVCEQFVTCGLLGKGRIWNGQSIGALTNGSTLPEGYYIYCPSVNSLSQAQIQQRMAPVMTICVNLAGAINSSQINVSVEE